MIYYYVVFKIIISNTSKAYRYPKERVANLLGSIIINNASYAVPLFYADYADFCR